MAAVALPTRSFAAMFTLLGSSASAAAQFRPPDPQEHFDRLANLAPGTSVEIHDPTTGKIRRGILEGCDRSSDVPTIRVKVTGERGGNRVSGLPVNLASRIEVSPNSKASRSQFGRRRSDAVAPLLRSCMDATNGYRYTNTSLVHTVVMGRKGMISTDVCETRIALSDGRGSFVEGFPQDLVRLRVDDRSAYHSHVMSSGFKKLSMYARMIRPKLVVFDGASAFLRSRHHWKTAHWIVLLDRTDWQFEEAIMEINELYVRRRDAGLPRVRGLRNPPSGTELMLFSR